MALSNWLSTFYKISIVFRFISTLIPLPTYTTTKDDPENLADSFSATIFNFSFRPKNERQESQQFSNSTNVVFPLIVGALPSLIVKVFLDNGLCKSISLRMLIVAPRTMCTLLTLSIDFFFFRIARHWRIKPNVTMAFYCTSFVPWVYFSRCSSYLPDTAILAAVLYVIVHSSLSDDDHHHHNHHHEPHHSCVTEHEKIYTQRQCSFNLGVLIALGLFHRLKFFVFVLAPFLQYLSNDFTAKKLLSKFATFSLTFAFTSAVLAFIDSLYYGSTNFDGYFDYENSALDFFKRNLTLAPLNSLRHSLTFHTLENRVFQPWYTHVLINLPFLYGFLGFVSLYYIAQCLSPAVLMNFHNVNPKYWLLLSSFIVPLICLSMYPLQEATSLCPLIIPLILLCVIRICQYKSRTQIYIFFAWVSWNLAAFAYHGLLRNGAVYECLNYLHKKHLVPQNDTDLSASLISYHYVLTDPPPDIWYMKNGYRRFDTYHYDKKTWSATLATNLHKIANGTSGNTDFVFIPATVDLCNLKLKRKVKLKYLATFRNHISPEAPLKAKHFFCAEENKRKRLCSSPCEQRMVDFLQELLSLRLFLVTKL